MPAKSEKQQKMFGIALAIKRGKLSCSYSPEACQMAKTMTMKQLKDYAGTRLKGLPKRKKRKRK